MTHDGDTSPAKCVDTGPAFAGDPEFFYVPGQQFIEDLTLAQVRTIDCGSLRLPQCPAQPLSPGERIPLLSEVFELVHAYRANRVTLNIETKVEAGAPVTATRKEERRSRAVTAPAPRRQGVGLNSTQVREALYEFCPGIEGAVGDAPPF